MSQRPPFDYSTQIEIPHYRRANWAGFYYATKAYYQQLPIAAAIFGAVVLAIKMLGTQEFQNSFPGLALFYIATAGLAISLFGILVFVMSFRHQAKAINKLCREIDGKTFHTTLTEEAVTIRNPNSGAIKTYPYNMLTIIVEDPNFLLLKAEQEVLYFGKSGLESVNALVFFLSQLNASK